MVPSLALMSQTVREWKNDSEDAFTAFSVCSDTRVGKRTRDKDNLDLNIHDLAFPATTDAEKIATQVQQAPPEHMTVVFSTYHSIGVLERAQKEHGLADFDLVICDEAHRTTGVTLRGEDHSNFVRIHDNAYVQARKRLYMTATPRVYGDQARARANEHDAVLASMDDETLFGKLLFHRSFGWAVENDLLSDFKVVVLAVDENAVPDAVRARLMGEEEKNNDKIGDATKIIGCYRGLAKIDFSRDTGKGLAPMNRALAFCESIEKSEIIETEFADVVDEYRQAFPDDAHTLQPEIKHIDGTYNVSRRDECLDWLKAEAGDQTCRILTNARVLSEGVDVPALDAIIFMHPRKSLIDVVQSVGRVMRKAPGKTLGYVILPVVVPPGVTTEEALDNNERYRVVWQTLNALRAHDERLENDINRAGLGEDISDKIEIIPIQKTAQGCKRVDIGKGAGGSAHPDLYIVQEQQGVLFYEVTEGIRAQIVDKCGTRDYWDQWGKDVAIIARAHIARITEITEQDGPERTAFLHFVKALRKDINPGVSESAAIEMLSQHLITKPVFDALFNNSDFTRENPVSQAMETVLNELHQHNLARDTEKLAKFYASVKRRAEGVVTAQGRQELIIKLYDQFFKSAFPMLTQRLGIVYTPVEVVDFIIHSVNDVLQSEFGQTLGSQGVHILDPFTGTGTFITRLLQSGLIKPEELEHKYKHEIHANEIVLLAYYIAAINIESTYHQLTHEKLDDTGYEPFKGILLADTFQMYEEDRDMISNLMMENSKRRTHQKQLLGK